MTPTAFVLTHPLTAQRPTRWDIQARYAMRHPDETVELPAETWLLELPPNEDDYPHPPHYRLADGRVVCLDAPLTPEQAAPLTDPQALVALAAYRPLDQALYEDWGLQVEHVDRNPPFRLIQCPLCGDASFTTVGFAEVWCDTCHATFTIRYTAGDAGFCLDAKIGHLQYGASRYLIPRSDDLVLTMVFKNSGDPLALRREGYCYRDDCADEQLALTDGQDGPLRAGLHACAIGDVYDWSFYGRAPSHYQSDRHGSYSLLWPDGREADSWPQTAFLSVSGLDCLAKRRLNDAISLLVNAQPSHSWGEDNWRRNRDELAAFLRSLAQRPSQPPHLRYRSPWPNRRLLADGERYLLHRWLVCQEESGWTTALPVWLVVVDAHADQYSRRWRVVRDNICPVCGQVVTPDDLTQTVDPDSPWRVSHSACRDAWTKHNWRPLVS